MPSLRSFVLGWANAKQTIGTIRFDHNHHDHNRCFYQCHHYQDVDVVEMLLMLKMMKQVCHCWVTEEDEVHNTIKLQTILCNDSAMMGKTLQGPPPWWWQQEKIWSNFKWPTVQTVQRCNRCKKPKVPKVNQVVGETHQETNIPPNDTSSSSSIIVVIIVFDVVVVVVVVDVVVIFHLSSPNFRSCTLVDEQNSVR